MTIPPNLYLGFYLSFSHPGTNNHIGPGLDRSTTFAAGDLELWEEILPLGQLGLHTKAKIDEMDLA